MPPTPPVITSAELLQALENLAPGDFVALDTEFMRESTYFPKLCLIQAANSGACAVLDPLTLPDLAPLWQFLGDRRRTKVLHAARQDLEVLATATRDPTAPGPIFDTQIAAALLGYPAQIGYGSLVAERLGHTLAKGHTRTDWSRRPLTPEQLQYAEDDVRYLAPLYLDLQAALQAAGRLEWLYEETRELEGLDLHGADPDAAWRRLKGLERLQPQQRATLKLLAQWREAAAIRHDKPRGWILADDALREIAERMPGTTQDLEAVGSVPAGVVRRRGAEILALIERGRAAAVNEVAASMPTRPQPQQVALVTKLMGLARETALHAKINAELLATRRDVEQLVFSRRTEHLLSGWRREIIGEPLVAAARESGMEIEESG
ncbi:MAG TPA: ribonuclease D [Steroidobacteraceae bacterium]|jgi:ribonuclease D|nr:ribonuclease D [Steroidobacteraceae bacterium]